MGSELLRHVFAKVILRLSAKIRLTTLLAQGPAEVAFLELLFSVESNGKPSAANDERSNREKCQGRRQLLGTERLLLGRG